MMPRVFEFSAQWQLVSVVGLVPPREQPEAHVFHWTADGVRRPNYFRWSWHPPTGAVVAGIVQHHVDQIPKDDSRPFGSWLRGFVFCAEKQIAVRSYYWPSDPYDNWDVRHARLDEEVWMAFAAVVRPHVPGYTLRHPVDNRWLMQTYSQYSRQW